MSHIHLPFRIIPHLFTLGLAIEKVLIAPHQDELVGVLDGLHIGIGLSKYPDLWSSPVFLIQLKMLLSHPGLGLVNSDVDYHFDCLHYSLSKLSNYSSNFNSQFHTENTVNPANIGPA